MEFRPLGRSGVQVSVLSLGSMLFGTVTSADEAAALVDRALDAGVNSVDTANVYGRGAAERALAPALSRSSRRDRLVLASKVHARMDDDDPNAAGSSRRHIVHECEASLRRLGVDHLDIYYLHRPTTQVPIDESLRALDDLVRSGKIRYVGTSGFAAWQLVESLWAAKEYGLNRTVVEQVAYSLLDRRAERELLPAAQTFGVGVTVWSPLAGGLLTGKYAGGNRPTGTRFEGGPVDDWSAKHFTAAADRVVDGVVRLAAQRGCSPTALSLAWLLAQPAVSSVVLGARTVDQLDDQLSAAAIELSVQDLAQLDEAAAPGRGTVPYFLDDSFADFRPHRHRW